MCTLTIVPFADGVQVGCNRDEQLRRPPALPPQVHLAGALRAAFPTDVPGGGTWIGVNERGLIVSMLNRTMAGDRRAAANLRCSRGVVTRHVLAAGDLDHAIRRLTALPVRGFDPFTAVMLHQRGLAVVTSDGRQYGVAVQAVDRPMCFTSSSLGDAVVHGPRLELFERWVAKAREPLLMQGAFHAHHWPDRQEISVAMQRDDAATVSRTWITVSGERATMTYEPLEDGRASLSCVTDIACTLSPASLLRPS